MDYLEEKYKRNCLTPKELEELQRKVKRNVGRATRRSVI